MPIQRFQQRRAGTGVATFDAPATPHQAPDFSPLSSRLADWAAQVNQERETQAAQRAREAGLAAQADVETGELAQAPDQYAFRFQQAFREGAYTLFEEQLKLDASRQVSDLSRKHHNNPQGFANAWQGYSETLVARLRESDPGAVPSVRQALEGYGNQGYQRLSDQLFARELREQGTRALQLYESRRATLADMILNDPDEQMYQDAVVELDDLLRAEFVDGLIGVEALEAGMRRNRESLATEYYRGQFNRSLGAQDLAGAEAVINSLLRGEGFEDNDRGRALASSLAQELRAAMGGESMSEQVALARRRLNAMLRGVREGAPIDMDNASGLLDFVVNHGTLSDGDFAHEMATAFATVQRLESQIENTPLVGLGALRSHVAEAYADLPESVHTAALSAIDSRIDRLERGRREGTELSAIQAGSWRDMSPEALLARHEQAQRIYGRSIDRLWDAPEVRESAQAFEEALANEQFGVAQAILGQSLGLVIDTPWAFINEALRHGSQSGPMYLFGALNLVGSDYNANEMMQNIAAAERVGVGTVLQRNNADAMDVLGDDDIMQALSALSMGSRNLREELIQATTALYAGMIDQQTGGMFSGSRRAARREIHRLLTPYMDTVEFANGAVLPEIYLSDHRLGIRAVRDEVNAFLEDPARLGFPPDQTERVGLVIPRRRADGTIGFWSAFPDPQTGRAGFLTDDTGQVISIDPQVTEERLQRDRGRREQERLDASWMESLGTVPGRLDPIELVSDFASWQELAPLRSAISRHGLEDGSVLEAIQRSGSGMNPQDVGARMYALLPPDAGRTARWDKIEGRHDLRGVRDIRYKNIAALVAVDRWQQAEEAFPGDRQAQLAAYWIGISSLLELKRDAGDRWIEDIPLAAKKFIGNVEQRLE